MKITENNSPQIYVQNYAENVENEALCSPNGNFHFRNYLKYTHIPCCYEVQEVWVSDGEIIQENSDSAISTSHSLVLQGLRQTGRQDSLNDNFLFSDTEKLDNLYEKLSKCGKNFVEFVNKYCVEFIEVPEYCNNRVCDNEGCKEHRGYLFRRNHAEQLVYLEKNIRKPKAWIFTGWKIDLGNIKREFLQEKLVLLYSILFKFSLSAFSVHMEVKLYPEWYKDYGMAYVHFHVVSGGISNLRLVRRMWNRQIRYQEAILLKDLTKYVSKYASKTPVMANCIDMELYHCLVYKTQMHRFSVGKKDLTLCRRESDFIPMSLLEFEIYNAYRRDAEKFRHYHPFIELYQTRDKPPDKNLDFWGCNVDA